MNKKNLKVKKSCSGLGLFTNVDIGKEDFIIEYKGELINNDEADRRGGKYLFTINDGLVMDGKKRDNIARYINHSCKPNCEAVIIEDENVVEIEAKRDIKAGEELTYHYGKEYLEDIIGRENCCCGKCKK